MSTTKWSYPNWKANVLAIVVEALCELRKFGRVELNYDERDLIRQYKDGVSEHSAAMGILEDTDLGEEDLSAVTDYIYNDEEFGSELF
jgi:hypothetical protein